MRHTNILAPWTSTHDPFRPPTFSFYFSSRSKREGLKTRFELGPFKREHTSRDVSIVMLGFPPCLTITTTQVSSANPRSFPLGEVGRCTTTFPGRVIEAVENRLSIKYRRHTQEASRQVPPFDHILYYRVGGHFFADGAPNPWSRANNTQKPHTSLGDRHLSTVEALELIFHLHNPLT